MQYEENPYHTRRAAHGRRGARGRQSKRTYAPEGEFEFHYLVFEGHDKVYGPEIEARGGKVIDTDDLAFS